MPTMRNRYMSSGGSRGPAGEDRSDTNAGPVRNRPGPADPETVRRKIAERTAEREPSRAPAAPTKKPASDLDGPTTIFNVNRKLRAKKQRDEDIIDNAQ